MELPDFPDVVAAAGRLDGVAHRTPVLTSRTADAMTGASLFFKCENLQRGGAFKFRGAYNAIAALPEARRRAGVAGPIRRATMASRSPTRRRSSVCRRRC